MDRRSFLAWHQHALVESGSIHGPANSAKRIKAAFIALALIEEVLDRGFEELIHILVLASGQFVIDPLFDLRGQVHIHWPFLLPNFTTARTGQASVRRGRELAQGLVCAAVISRMNATSSSRYGVPSRRKIS